MVPQKQIAELQGRQQAHCRRKMIVQTQGLMKGHYLDYCYCSDLLPTQTHSVDQQTQKIRPNRSDLHRTHHSLQLNRTPRKQASAQMIGAGVIARTQIVRMLILVEGVVQSRMEHSDLIQRLRWVEVVAQMLKVLGLTGQTRM